MVKLSTKEDLQPFLRQKEVQQLNITSITNYFNNQYGQCALHVFMQVHWPFLCENIYCL